MIKKKFLFFTLALALSVIGNSYLLYLFVPWLIAPALLMLLVCNLIPSFCGEGIYKARLRLCSHGNITLRLFVVYTLASLVVNIVFAFILLPLRWIDLLIGLGVCIGVGSVVFWNGIISVYLSSTQLGIKHRVIGALLGLVPVLNLIMLFKIIKITGREVCFEADKIRLNSARREDKVCETKYPILLVHGVFFRDYKLLNYWGRIPSELKKNGATVFYGKQQSALPVKKSASELSWEIRKIIERENCGKVNIIAHSKGGLDSRYAIQNYGIGEYVASLTTVNTPHRGCKFADYLLEKAPKKLVASVSKKYNGIFRALGDDSPDFLGAVSDLTSKRCTEFNKEVTDTKGVYCQSVGSIQKKARSGQFPLNLTYRLVNIFDGENDGLVGEESFPWGERYIINRAKGSRGISHADMIDLNREDIPGFDVREFYVQLVSDLKNRGF